mgnify:CR=1 FL=1
MSHGTIASNTPGLRTRSNVAPTTPPSPLVAMTAPLSRGYSRSSRR